MAYDPRFAYAPPLRRQSQAPKVLIGILAIIIAVVAAALVIRSAQSSRATIDSGSVAVGIEQEIRNTTAVDTTVDCPDGIPLQTNRIFDCSVRPLSSSVQPFDLVIRVTEDDAHGHFHWVVTSQGSVGGPNIQSGSN